MIADANLRLALLDEVSVARAGDYYWLSTLREPYTAHRAVAGGPQWDDLEARLGIDRLPELEDFLRTLPLPTGELAAVTHLCLDGDREVYTVFPGWWHFGNHFDIAALDGIGMCPAVTDLTLGQGMFSDCSLAPLTGLPDLRHLRMCALDRWVDVDALPAIASLRTLDVANLGSARDAGAWRPVLAALRGNGVTVTG
ncbi:DUF6892 domain-containing protein [Dactylosporangium cerinum]|uniref:DUF6892 domain-containing protein n=1 Tax=Dactylosporangium cerinum TaxID=1434730 RepID=A0ABV9W513_9ACTN